MQSLPTSFAHPECYAQAIKGCSSEISREHYVSQCVLKAVSRGDRTVLVHGLKFQAPGEEKALGISKLVGTVLCRAHNSALSDLDGTAVTFFSRMEGLILDSDDATSGLRHPIDGYSLERWLLKTLCGGLFCGVFRASHDGSLKSELPPLEWLEVLFKRRSLPLGQGLYVYHGPPGTHFQVDRHVLRLEVLKAKAAKSEGDKAGEEAVVGLRMWLFGVEFRFFAVDLAAKCMGNANMNYRPRRLLVGTNGKRTLSLKWGQNGGHEDLQIFASEFRDG